MKFTNEIKNPFLAFGNPSKLVINGIQQKCDNVTKAVNKLIKSQQRITAFTITKINGNVSVYVAMCEFYNRGNE